SVVQMCTIHISVTQFEMDVKHQVIAETEIIERVTKIDNEISVFVKELLIFFAETYKDHFGFPGGPIHDACTTMYLINPDMFTFENVNVTIETKGEATYGMTVVDLLKTTGKPENVKFATGVDTETFWNIFQDILASYGETDE